MRAIAFALMAEDWTQAIVRSSTNTEDLPGFNGAGLYDSVLVQVASPTLWTDPAVGLPIIANAAAEVWASVWSDRAALEREAFGIDHSEVGMAVLIQPWLDGRTVLANGVALSDQGARSSTVINSLPGSTERVTGPSAGVMAEQLMLHPNSTSGLPFDTEILCTTSLPLLPPAATVLLQSETFALHEAILKLKAAMGPRLNVEFLVVASQTGSSAAGTLD